VQKPLKNCGILMKDDDIFDPIFRPWLDVSKEYARAWEETPDFHWSYGERAHISILAAAIWDAGGIALEEYATKKARDKKHYSGRCDFCFKLTKSPKSTGYIAEAKHRNVNCGNLRSLPAKLEKTVATAQNAMSDCHAHLKPNERRLSLVFITFRNRPKAEDKVRSEDIISAVGATHKKLKTHTTFWQFPDWATNQSEDSWRYPGTAVFIDLLQK
jgi:hypothetical protein